MKARTAVRVARPLVVAAFSFCSSITATDAAVPPAPAAPVLLQQGPQWTADARRDFYSRDQGSRMIPLAWLTALQARDGTPFIGDVLARYGYLKNDLDRPSKVPLGFTVTRSNGVDTVGMTCAACHTREITFSGTSYRIDGGPAIVDFQGFLVDLDAAVGSTLDTPDRFADFARTVLGSKPSPAAVDQLKQAVADWYLPFHTIVSRAMPTPAWGTGRLDAISMIFNRVTGLDIGPPPTYLIPDNIKPADAPVRYPFLWNAWKQDKTQWPGFADNGNNTLGLARNVGEVLGVFGVVHPKQDLLNPLRINYASGSSPNVAGLLQLELLIRKIGAPKWPWLVDPVLSAKGASIFAANCSTGCHLETPGQFRSPLHGTWETKIQNVGTDTREWSILERRVDPGVLEGARLGPLDASLKNPEEPINVLKLVVLGWILEKPFDPFDVNRKLPLHGLQTDRVLTARSNALSGVFTIKDSPDGKGSYESRSLRGIWAAAPYLHNGSVATLAELLKPASQRMPAFKVGPAYDTNDVGLASEQPSPVAQTMQTTGCVGGQLDSGNSRCGHEFGWALSPDDKRALLEYLKTL